jgi:hypothetical protein
MGTSKKKRAAKLRMMKQNPNGGSLKKRKVGVAETLTIDVEEGEEWFADFDSESESEDEDVGLEIGEEEPAYFHLSRRSKELDESREKMASDGVLLNTHEFKHELNAAGTRLLPNADEKKAKSAFLNKVSWSDVSSYLCIEGFVSF